MDDTKNRPVSPRSGAPLPRGKPFQPGKEAQESGRNGGKKSAAARAARKTLREELLSLLDEEITVTDKQTGNTSTMTTQAAISAALIKQGISGNYRAYEIIRDTIGEKPVDNVNIVTADYSALENAFSGLYGGDNA